MINIPKGTKDVLPQDSYRWQAVEEQVREHCRLYGFREIRTPAFEHTELFTRSIGEDTDVVGKEMYTFLDKGDRSITLKAEGTAPVARSYVENALEALSLPLKMYYITPVFRYENPQKGRLREHHQFGVEAYGSDSPFMDYEVVDLAYSFLKKMGIGNLSLRLNNIGCPVCRRKYNDALKAYLREREQSLCATCRERLQRNPLRILDCKVPSCQQIVDGAPVITDYVCDDCKTHFDALLHILDESGIPYSVDPKIVRGLDYYTKTVFEFVTDSVGTVCGGGRYNNLVESVGGKPTPCVGFGMGIERLLFILDHEGLSVGQPFTPDLYLVSQCERAVSYNLKTASDLRKAGISCDFDLMGRSVKAQFKYADKLKAKFVVVIGESELESGTCNVKNMNDGENEQILLEHLTEYLTEKKKCLNF